MINVFILQSKVLFLCSNMYAKVSDSAHAIFSAYLPSFPLNVVNDAEN